MKKQFLAIMLISILMCSMAAKPVDYDKLYSVCLDKAGGINNSIVADCSEEVTEAAEKEIAVLLRRLIKAHPESIKLINLAQSSWKAYRDAQCQLNGNYIGSPMYSYCPMQETMVRVDELRSFSRLN